MPTAAASQPGGRMVPVTTKGKGLNLLDFFGMPKKSIQAKAQEPEPRADAAPAAPIVPAAPVAPRSTSKHEVPLPGRQSIQSKRKHKQQVPSKPKYSVGTRIKKRFEDGIWYEGTIVSVPNKGGFYHVKYDDSDSDDNTEQDLEGSHVVIHPSPTDTDTPTTKTNQPPGKGLVTPASQRMPDSTSSSSSMRLPAVTRSTIHTTTSHNKRRRLVIDEDDTDDDEFFLDESQDEDEEEDDDWKSHTPSRTSLRSLRKRRVVESDEDENQDDDDDDIENQVPNPVKSAATKSVTTNSKASMKANQEPTTKPKTQDASLGWKFLNGKGSTSSSQKAKKITNRTKPTVSTARASRKTPTSASASTSVAPPKKEKLDSRGRKFIKTPYTDGDDLPVISEPQAMMDDMILNLTKDNTDILKGLLQKLHRRPLRIATMCSGTESPVLALDMLSKAMEEYCHKHYPDSDFSHEMQIEHVFSCEIEPFKQAYIERNFQPPLLFRDIRELGNDEAYTAYGSLAKVPNEPGSVDMLIAGTSCVDYSNLNNNQKTIDEKGESGQTWRGLVQWVERAKPAIVILENVKKAPWKKKEEIFEKLGYYAKATYVDTKHYYIPQTRQRGYLVAVLKNSGVSSNVGQAWIDQIVALKRPTSASLDAFMFSNDDPRVLRGRARLTNCDDEDDNNHTNWAKCEVLHHLAREEEQLGDRRRFTGWSDTGNGTSLPGFAWNEWASKQVHRIHDLLEINTLRCAHDGMDPTMKTMIWDLSQNVGRDTMGRLGLSQCLTPSGVQYVSNRGGPLVGEELLLLQGIPADDLLLTKETEKNLKDLAGNAMSTTVVGACILSALVLGYKAFPERTRRGQHTVVKTLVPRPLAPAKGDVVISQSLGDYTKTSLNLGAIAVSCDVKALMGVAENSARKCNSEGIETVLPISSLLVCTECGQTSSIDSASPPRKFEEHSFVPMTGESRTNPGIFRKLLLSFLPMRIVFKDFHLRKIAKPETVDTQFWGTFSEALALATGEGTVYQYETCRRANTWIIQYTSFVNTRLELRLSGKDVTWYLFAQAPAIRGELRDALERPIARMSITPGSTSLTDGVWEMCLPKIQTVVLSIRGAGEKVESWQAWLGLKTEFTGKGTCRSTKLVVNVKSPGFESLKAAIDGEYELLPKCGTACGSLHKKIRTVAGQPDMFFFYDAGRRSYPDDDTFVFSRHKDRIDYKECRDILLSIDPSAHFAPTFSSEEDHFIEDQLKGVIHGHWVPTDARIECKQVSTKSSVAYPQKVNISLAEGGWKISPSILETTITMPTLSEIYTRCTRHVGVTMDVNLKKSKRLFDEVAFALARCELPISLTEWMSVDSKSAIRSRGEELPCSTCAPQKPSVKFAVVTRGVKKEIVPIECGIEAAEYEQAVKSRPEPWAVHLLANHGTESPDLFGTLELKIGVNVFSLLHRSIVLFPQGSLARRAMISLRGGNCHSICSWRIIPHVEKLYDASDFPKLNLTSNKLDPQANQPLEFRGKGRYPLRIEQLRSLSWMLEQEATEEPFLEQEVSEDLLPRLNWRAEGRVQRPVLVRGGIIADEVGYGKTAITLGLICAAPSVNGPAPEIPNEYKQSYLASNATLVIIPAHLIGQWPHEIKKFCPTKRVIVLKDQNSFRHHTIRDIQKADIICVNFNVLSGEKYFENLAHLGGVNSTGIKKGGKSGGRHFNSVYAEALAGLARRLPLLRTDPAQAFQDMKKALTSHDEFDGGAIRLDRKSTVYKLVTEEATKSIGKKKGKSPSKKPKKKGPDVVDCGDPWQLNSAKVQKDFREMHSPPLEMFYFARVVVDEFHYLSIQSDRARVLALVQNLKSSYRWCLSGTPPHANFKDVQTLADLLGVHLGCDDVLPGTKLNAKGKTSAEKFATLLENRSLQWHQGRHKQAQLFLDRFVRQNIAEIDEIQCEEHVEFVTMPPVEKAIYLELQSHLEALDLTSRKSMKAKKSAKGDREIRMNAILDGSSTPAEALLKRCSHFASSAGEKTALEACDGVIKRRSDQLEECKAVLRDGVAEAALRRQRILEHQPDWQGQKETEKGEVEDTLNTFLNGVAKNKSVSQGADDEIHRVIAAVVKEALDNPGKYCQHAAFDVDGDFGEEELSPKKKRKMAKEALSPEALYRMKFRLREHVHRLNTNTKELCGRMRSLRFFNAVREIQLLDSFVCPGSRCGCKSGQKLTRDEIGVFSTCGHHGCLKAMQRCAEREECFELSCKAQISRSCLVPASALGADKESATGEYGAKLTAVVKKVKSLVNQGDRVIVFVQFLDLKKQVAAALENHGVKTLLVAGTVGQQVKAVDVMQKEKPGKDDPRVLLLTMDDESSAGVNLTTCNHAVFVHPLSADTKQLYDAYETQAIGRIRRYGQVKTVHIWRFLAVDTIDTRIYQERTGKDVTSMPL